MGGGGGCPADSLEEVVEYGGGGGIICGAGIGIGIVVDVGTWSSCSS